MADDENKEEQESSDENAKTIRYSDTEDKTSTYADSSKKSRSDSNSSRNPIISIYNLLVGDRIEVNHSFYNVLEIISDEGVTGEASIYKIQDKESKVFSLKLYPELRDSRFEPNPLTLAKIKSIEDPDILRLYDFGTGTKKYLNKYCYEVSDFAEGGTLLYVKNFKEKYTPSFIENSIVPEIFNGIKTLHKHRIYHCDLKPQNIFYLDKDQTNLIIGDYGSAKTFDELNDKDKRSQIAAVTSTWLGSKNYMALEQNQGIISVKNDYYSFGMIILHLLYPDEFEQGVKGKFISRLVQSQPILENFNKDYYRLNKLIEGLTLVNFNNRWSQEEIENWIQGNLPEVIYTWKSSIPEIKLSATKILRSEEDIINYIKEEKNWYDNLIVQEDGVGHLFYKWFVEKRGAEEHQTFKEMIKYYRQYGQEYVREAIINFFNPEGNVNVEKKKFNFNETGKVNSSVKLFFEFLDDVWKTKNLDELKFYIFQLEFALGLAMNSEDTTLSTEASLVLQTIAAEFNVSPRKDFNDYKAEIFSKLNLESLLNLFYQFNPQRSFKDLSNKQYNSLEEVGFYFAKNKNLYDNLYLKLERNNFLTKIKKDELKSSSFNQLLFYVFRDKIKTDIEFLGLDVGKNRELNIKYNFRKSLTEYFNSINIPLVLFDSNYTFKPLTFIYKKRFYNSFNSVFKKFLHYLNIEHNLEERLLTIENKSNFYKTFRKKLFNNYLSNGAVIHLLISAAIGTLIAFIITDSAIKSFEEYPYSYLKNFSFIWLITSSIIFGFGFSSSNQKAIRLSLTLYALSISLFLLFAFWFSEQKKLINLSNAIMLSNQNNSDAKTIEKQKSNKTKTKSNNNKTKSSTVKVSENPSGEINSESNKIIPYNLLTKIPQVIYKPEVPSLIDESGNMLNGWVSVQVLVNSKGLVEKSLIKSSSNEKLNGSALVTANLYRFTSPEKDDRKVKSWIDLTIIYK